MSNNSENPPNPPLLSLIASNRLDTDAPNQVLSELGETLANTNFPSDATLPSDPAQRLVEMILFHGDEEALLQLDKYLVQFDLNGTPMDQIARQLDISVPAARRFMNDYRSRLARQMERLEVTSMLGDSLNALKHVRTKFMQSFNRPNATLSEQCASADRILKTEQIKYKVLESVNYFAKKSYTVNEPDEFAPRREAGYLSDMLKNIMEGRELEEDQFYQNTIDVE